MALTTIDTVNGRRAASLTLGDAVRQRWRCLICGFVYDEALGLPQEGISPGTAWVDVPDTWTCPDCGVGKVDFSMVPVADRD